MVLLESSRGAAETTGASDPKLTECIMYITYIYTKETSNHLLLTVSGKHQLTRSWRGGSIYIYIYVYIYIYIYIRCIIYKLQNLRQLVLIILIYLWNPLGSSSDQKPQAESVLCSMDYPSQQQGPRVRGIHVPSVHYLTGISPSVASMISFQAFQSFQRQTAACTLIFSTDSVRFPADLRLNSRHRMASTRIANLPNVPHTLKDIERQQPKPQQAALVTFAQQFINALHSESKLTSTAGSTSVCEPQGVVLCTPAGKIWMLALQLPDRCYDRRQSRNRRGWRVSS